MLCTGDVCEGACFASVAALLTLLCVLEEETRLHGAPTSPSPSCSGSGLVSAMFPTCQSADLTWHWGWGSYLYLLRGEIIDVSLDIQGGPKVESVTLSHPGLLLGSSVYYSYTR